MLFTSKINTPIGTLQITCTESYVTEITFPGVNIKTEEGKPVAPKSFPSVMTMAAEQLQEYLVGKRTLFDLPISPHGTDFQLRVWHTIQNIPYGTTLTYGEVAKKLGGIGKARAVGGAAHANPLPLIIPCHRVIGAQGSLTGFGGGLKLKERLLNMETLDRNKQMKH